MGNRDRKFRLETSRTRPRQTIDQTGLYITSQSRQPRRKSRLGRSSSAATTTVGCLAINLTPGWLLQFEMWSLEFPWSLELGIWSFYFASFSNVPSAST